MRVNFTLQTDGKGFWSDCVRKVKVFRIEVPYLDYVDENDAFGELRAYFRIKDWDTYKHGLIYTDERWLKQFRAAMKKKFKLPQRAINDITYSEQGMQGDNYVSMDISEHFIREFKDIAALVS